MSTTCNARSLAPYPCFYRDRHHQLHSNIPSGPGVAEDGAHLCMLRPGHGGSHGKRTRTLLCEAEDYYIRNLFHRTYEVMSYAWDNEHQLVARPTIERQSTLVFPTLPKQNQTK